MTVGMRDFVGELAREPLLFRETFRNQASVEANGATLVGTGTTFNDGLVLNGSGNLLYTLLGSNQLSATLTFRIEFTLGFAGNDGVAHAFITAVTPGGSACLAIWKTAANEMQVLVGATTVVTIAYATWSAALVAGKNTIIASLTSGANTVWLNGTSIGTSAIAWAHKGSEVYTVIGSSWGGANRFIGTIHSFEIYGSVATAVDEPHLRNGTLISALDNPLVVLPGKSFYKRASDSKFVTEVQGKAGITEALMGSDGTTTTQFPSIIRPRGFSFDGGDQINLGDNDQFSFTNGANDLPFSFACINHVDTVANGAIFGKVGAQVTNGEYTIYHQVSGSVLLTLFLLIDNTTETFQGRYDPWGLIRPGRDIVMVFTSDGSGTMAGMRIYANAIRIDSADLAMPGYVRMRNTAYNLTLGVNAAIPASGPAKQILQTFFDYALSPLQVRALTARLRRQARAA